MEKIKTIVVTGGTKGIGKAILLRFGKEGFNIATCSRNIENLKRFEEEAKAFGITSKVLTIQADLSEKEECFKFASIVNEEFPAIDVLVNNAGLYVPGMIHEEDDGVLEQMVNTNLYSAYHTSRAFLPQMIKNKSGYVFNICSTASEMPYINGGSYCISKYAMLGMSKVLREEMKDKGIRVTAVMPGPTFTASWDGVDVPEDRFMPPEDIAEAVYSTYCLSPRTNLEELTLRPQLGDL